LSEFATQQLQHFAFNFRFLDCSSAVKYDEDHLPNLPMAFLLVLLGFIAQGFASVNPPQVNFQHSAFLSGSNFLGYRSLPNMATLLENTNGWHPGERAVHSLLKVPTSGRRNPTAVGLPPSFAYRVTVSPLLAVGTVDEQGRPWTSLWGGERGFARPVAEGVLGVQSLVDKTNDPVVRILLGDVADGEVFQPEGDRTMSALSIDLESRDRVKLAGRMLVGTVVGKPDNTSIVEAQIAMIVQESLGNCPKYLNKKTIRAHIPSPQVVSSSLPLPPEALALIEQADLFFLSSTNGQTMDTNHRGGPAGFVRVLSNSPAEGVALIYPEYSGNRLYQTLGNLHTNPLVGIAIPDFITSDILYLTGSTELLVGPAAAAVMPHTNLAVKITVTSALLVKDGLPFRGTPGEPSPYNPRVRRLVTEHPPPISPEAQEDPASPLATATLLRRESLTPTIARFTFHLQQTTTQPNSSASPTKPLTWHPGQHITLSFASELDLGYSHMREDDPQSLNDDFVRTFTISSPPPPPPSLPTEAGHSQAAVGNGVEVQLTLRRHGPVTGLLFAQKLGARAGRLEVPVLGIGGMEGFRILDSPYPAAAAAEAEGEGRERKLEKKAVFVAGGIGITPLLAQAPGVLAAGRDIEVLWSLRAEDLGLAVDSFERIEGLGSVTRVFVTGVADGGSGDDWEGIIEKLRQLGAKVEARRMERGDVLGVRDSTSGTKYYACASPGLMRSVLDWLADEEVVYESFEY
jgi:NAD(P)H-flavin reductase